MKTRLACILGLALLATSPICSGSLAYADALEAESSMLMTLAPDVNAYDAASQDKLHCVLYSDGADNCIVNAQFPVVDQLSSAVDESEPAATELAPAIRSFDAIPVIVTQSVTIAAPGLDPGAGVVPAFAGSIPAPSMTEPALDPDADTTTDELPAPAGQSADAIVVAIVQSATLAVPGQNPRDNEEPALIEPISASQTPSAALETKTTTLGNDE